MQDLNDLYYFAQVVEHGGFAPAGRALGVAKSLLSRRISALEERLGVRLLQRSTRHVAVTEMGQIYFQHCQAMLVEAEAAQEAIDSRRAEPCGTVRLSCPTALLDICVGEFLTTFMERYPGVKIEVDSTDRRVDVIEERMDLALRVRPRPMEDSELILRVLSERSQCLVASPVLLNAAGYPRVPADLSALPSLSLGQPQQRHIWHLIGPKRAEARIEHSPRLITRNMNTLRQAAVAGLGVVQMPTMMIRQQLERGELKAVMLDWAPRGEVIHAVMPSRRGLLPGVRALVDYLVERFTGPEFNDEMPPPNA